jgi:hypothetical protein
MENSKQAFLATLLALSAPNAVDAEEPYVPSFHGSLTADANLEVALIERRLGRCLFEKGEISDPDEDPVTAELELPIGSGEPVKVTVIDYKDRRKHDVMSMEQGAFVYEDEDFDGSLDYLEKDEKELPIGRSQGQFERLLIEASEVCGGISQEDLEKLPEWMRKNKGEGPLLKPAFASAPNVPGRGDILAQYCGNGAVGPALLKIFFKEKAQSVVRLRSDRGKCSGYWAGPGLVVTNAHCIDDRENRGDIVIEWPSRLNDRGDAITHVYRSTGGTILYSSRRYLSTDIAVVRMDPRSPATPLEILDTPRETFFAITLGQPLNTSWTSNAVSGVYDNEVFAIDFEDECVDGPGMSGSAVTDLQGRVLGTISRMDNPSIGDDFYLVPNASTRKLLDDPRLNEAESFAPVEECAVEYYEVMTTKGIRFNIEPIESTCRKVRFDRKGNSRRR